MCRRRRTGPSQGTVQPRTEVVVQQSVKRLVQRILQPPAAWLRSQAHISRQLLVVPPVIHMHSSPAECLQNESLLCVLGLGEGVVHTKMGDTRL